MTTDLPRTVLSLLAHPDDAEILCAGTLLRLKKMGWQIHIATMSAGDCGTTTMSADQITKVRFREATNAAREIGATYHCLGERDAQVVYDKPTIEKVMKLFRQVMPGMVFTHQSRDYMMDHEMTTNLARTASHLYGSPNASDVPFAGGQKHAGVPYLYYCDLLEGIDPLGELVLPTTVIDICQELEQKAAALACHASQREWLRAHQGMDEYVDAMRRHSAMRGAMIDSPAAEGFIQHRGHSYPRNDLLAELLKKEN